MCTDTAEVTSVEAISDVIAAGARELQAHVKAVLSCGNAGLHAHRDEEITTILDEQRLRGYLADVTAADLEEAGEAKMRLDAGILHLCAECDDEIPEKRRVAKPTATLCRDCQEAKDLAEALERRARLNGEISYSTTTYLKP